MINADFNPITYSDFRDLGRAEHYSVVISDRAGNCPKKQKFKLTIPRFWKRKVSEFF